MVRNAEVILGLVQLGLQAVHTGDGQHELRGVRPHLPWEREERGRGRERERRCQAKNLVDIQYLMYWVSFYVQKLNLYECGQRDRREKEGERERGREGGRGEREQTCFPFTIAPG